MINFLRKLSSTLSFAVMAIASAAIVAQGQEAALEVVTVDVAGYRFDLPLSPILRISDLKRDVVFDGRFDSAQMKLAYQSVSDEKLAELRTSDEKLTELRANPPMKVDQFTYFFNKSDGHCDGPQWLLDACKTFSGLRETYPPISVAYLQVSRKLRNDFVPEKSPVIALEDMPEMRNGERAYIAIPTKLDIFLSNCGRFELGNSSYTCIYAADLADAVRVVVRYFVKEGHQGDISAVVSRVERLFTEKLMKSQP